MPEPKAQLVDPQGPIDVPGLSVTGVTTATGGFVGAVQGGKAERRFRSLTRDRKSVV